jgi:hypothetical protein
MGSETHAKPIVKTVINDLKDNTTIPNPVKWNPFPFIVSSYCMLNAKDRNIDSARLTFTPMGQDCVLAYTIVLLKTHIQGQATILLVDPAVYGVLALFCRLPSAS